MFGVLAPENGLEEALRKWAKKFNAEVDWIFVGALRTLWLWRNPEQRKALEWTPFQSSGGSPGGRRAIRVLAPRVGNSSFHVGQVSGNGTPAV